MVLPTLAILFDLREIFVVGDAYIWLILANLSESWARPFLFNTASGTNAVLIGHGHKNTTCVCNWIHWDKIATAKVIVVNYL